MSFQALYRKYRSQSFGELVGQEPVATALRNAVRDDRVGHAYLFTGPRGTGKTSTARILAKALNCEHPTPEGEPDNTCESCLAITNGSSMDVMELDAASNNGVNEMRELLGRVAYRSAGGRWKVYIIDEVHMLSAAASNALLKTLEEPPDHVKFVLATTDPHKVLPTIRSRTQQFEFSLLSTDALAAHLAWVAVQEGVAADADALHLIARRAAGSARDALSLLDQAIAHGDGRVEDAAVRDLFEVTAFDRQAAIVDAVANEDPATALSAVDDIMETGVDARTLADELLRYLRDVYVLAASRGAVRVDRLPEEQVRLRAQGEELGAGAVQRAIETLGSAVADMTRAPDARLVLEVAVVRISRRELGTQVEVLLDRIERLERTVEELRHGGVAPRSADASAPVDAPAGSRPGDDPAPPPVRSAPSAARPPAREAPAPRSASAPVDPTPTPAPAEAPSRPSRPAAGSGLARPTIGALRRGGDATPGGEPRNREAPPAPPPDGPADAPAAAEAPGPGPGPVATVAPPAADGPADEPAAASTVPDLDTVVLRWPEVLDVLEGRVRLAVNEMHPIRVEGTTIVVALANAAQRHQATLEGGREPVGRALARVFGAPLAVRVELSDQFVPRQPSAGDRQAAGDRPSGRRAAPAGREPEPAPVPAPRPRSAAPPVAVADDAPPPIDPGPDDDEYEAYDPAELVDAPPQHAAPVDSVARMIQLFDATVVEDGPSS